MLWFIAEIFLFLVVAGLCFWAFGWWARGKFMSGSSSEESIDYESQIRQVDKKVDEERKRAMNSESSIEENVKVFKGNFEKHRTSYQNHVDNGHEKSASYDDSKITKRVNELSQSLTSLSSEAKSHFASSHSDTVYDDGGLKSQIMALKSSFGGSSKEYDDSSIRSELNKLSEDMRNLNTACKDHFKSSHSDTVFNDANLVSKMKDLANMQRDLEAQLKKHNDMPHGGKSYDDAEIRKTLSKISQKQVSLEDSMMRHEKKPHDQKSYDDSDVRSMLVKLEKSQGSLSNQINKHTSMSHDFSGYDDTKINKDLTSIASSLQEYAREIDAVKKSIDKHQQMPHGTGEGFDEKVIAIDRKTSKLQNSQESVRQALTKIEEALAKLEASYKMQRSQAKTVRAPKPAKASKPRKAAPKPRKPKANRKPDDLTVIKGIGKVIQGKLRRYGVKYYEQIAAWTAQDIRDFDERLAFRGRIRRESWVPQAKKLSANREKLKKAS